jgi:transcriptional regulator with XRE-family HTH domain
MEVKRLVIDKDLTQSDIAKMMGVTQPQISNWFYAKRFPSSTNLIKLSSILDMQPEELLSKLQTIKQENQ